MTDQTMNQVEATNENRPTSTADIVAASNKSNVDMTQPAAPTYASEIAAMKTGPAPLLTSSVTGELRSRWTDVQAGFVDEPRASVEKADALVAEVMKQVAEKFANERSTLEGQWSRGDNVSTEDLRLALKHYRTFFDRLLML